MIDVLTSEFVQSARLNGFPERRIVWTIALRSSLVPTVQIIAMLVPYLVGGLIVVETVFSYPGIGSQFLGGVLSGEIRLVQAVAVLSAALTIFANLSADLLVMFLVPKLRPGASR
jgi:peptide/nickel transport system permease protein